MKHNQLILMVIVGSILFSSCYNGISKDQSDTTTNNNELPLVIRPFINKPDTRVSNNQFEFSDKIGLFLFENKEEDKIHINNIPFEYTKGNIFISEHEAYYPKNQKEHLVYAYYPYQKENTLKDEGTIKLNIHSNQSNIKEFYKSDFLYAVNEEARSSKRALQLKFNHQLAQVNIVLKVASPYTSEDLSTINPQIKLINMPTHACLNLHSEEFDQYKEFKDIIPHTNWESENNLLQGCKAIILPINTLDNQKIQIEAEDIIYECDFPTNASFQPNTTNKIMINYTPSKGIEVAEVESNIGGWSDGENINIDARPLLDAISIQSLEFDQSNILYLENNRGHKRAIICKELLTTEDSEFVATTLYTMTDNQVNHQKGVILTVEDSNYNNLLSATISHQQNELTITPSKMAPIRCIFSDKEGNISYSAPEESEIIILKDMMIKDIRNEEIREYPIVKIGSQFWMKSNLNTQYYFDGSKLAHAIDQEVINAGYATFNEAPNEKLYNTALIEGDRSVCPKGWHIPNSDEVDQLFSYVRNTTYLSDAQTHHYSYANLSGLSLQIGAAYSSEFNLTVKSTAFWVKDNDKKLFNIRIDKLVEPVLKPVEPKEKKMISIRCIQNL